MKNENTIYNVTLKNGINVEGPEGNIMLHTLQRAARDSSREQRVRGLALTLATKATTDVEVNTFTIDQPSDGAFGLNGESGKTLSVVRPGAGTVFAVIGEFDPSNPIPAEYLPTPKKGQRHSGSARRGGPNRDSGKSQKKDRAPGFAKAYVANDEATVRVFGDEAPLTPDTSGDYKVGPATFTVNREVLVSDEQGNPLAIVSSISPKSGPVNRMRYKDTDHDSVRFVYQRTSATEKFEARIRFGTPDSSSIAPMIRNGEAVLAIGDFLIPVPKPGTYNAGDTFTLKAGTIEVTGIWERAANGKLEVAHLTSNGPEFSNSRESTNECRFRFRKQDTDNYRVDYRLGSHTPSFGTRWLQDAGVGFVSLYGSEQQVVAGERKEGESFSLTFGTPEGDLVVNGTWHLVGDKYQIAELKTPEGYTFHCRSQHVPVCRMKFQRQDDNSFRCVIETGGFSRKPKKAPKKS